MDKKLQEFVKSYMEQFDPSYGFQLFDNNSSYSFITYLQERFENVKMIDEDLKDLVTIGFTISLCAYKGLFGEKFTEDNFRENFEFFLEMALN